MVEIGERREMSGSIKAFLFIQFLLGVVLTESLTQAQRNERRSSPVRKFPFLMKLHTRNFDRVVENNQFVLVEFFDPACPACQLFRSEYTRTTRILKKHPVTKNVRVGKMNVVQNWSVAARFDVILVPTIILFRNGVPIKYSGQRSAIPLARWVQSVVAQTLNPRRDPHWWN